MSAHQLRDPGFLELVERGRGRRSGENQLVLEMTETVVVAGRRRDRPRPARAAGAGRGLAIDDFGVGLLLDRLPAAPAGRHAQDRPQLHPRHRHQTRGRPRWSRRSCVMGAALDLRWSPRASSGRPRWPAAAPGRLHRWARATCSAGRSRCADGRIARPRRPVPLRRRRWSGPLTAAERDTRRLVAGLGSGYPGTTYGDVTVSSHRPPRRYPVTVDVRPADPDRPPARARAGRRGEPRAPPHRWPRSGCRTSTCPWSAGPRLRRRARRRGLGARRSRRCPTSRAPA